MFYRLLKSFYDLKQSNELWNQNIIVFYKSIDFVQLNKDLIILIKQFKDEISIVSIYVNDFFLVSNIMNTLNILEISLAKKYETKDLGKPKTIISWQVGQDMVPKTIKIDQLAFVRALVIKKDFTNCNVSIILIKTGTKIKIENPKDYKKVNLQTY